MILQNIIFPNTDFNAVEEAYFRLQGGTKFTLNDNKILFAEGASAEFDTYFNGFSVCKWKKYTDVGQVFLLLRLQGRFTIELYNEYRAKNQNERKLLGSFSFGSEQPATFETAIPPSAEEGICAFRILCEGKEGAFFGGTYCSARGEDEFADVYFALDICTFRREEFVRRNMEILRKSIAGPGCPLYGKVEAFISDNGNSLSGEFAEYVHIFPNKNAGGAGGFGRGMMEILRAENYNKFTHIIMMDDDIVFCAETLYRTWALAKTLKKEYGSAFIGGAMLKLNQPNIQSEAINYWNGRNGVPVKHLYDITNLNYVLKNEIEDRGDHFGWWYCCMPVGVVRADNLPLPIFIKRDDIEYGIRNGSCFITLNGLCVLHEDFASKRRGYLEYYYARNMCILNAVHYPSFRKKQLKKLLLRVIADNILRYRYSDANLALKGVEDFLRGVDWLKNTDADKLNQTVLQSTYRLKPAEKLSVGFSHGIYEKNLQWVKKHKKSFKRVMLGWFLPAKHAVRYAPVNQAPAGAYYRAKTVVNYDESSHKAFMTYKSWRQLFNVLGNYRRICKLIDRRFDQVRGEYCMRFPELISLNFWEKYLHEEGSAADDPSVIRSEFELNRLRRAKRNLRTDRKRLAELRIARCLERVFFFWKPIKQNRVAFYVHERKGYSCNPKYIAEELRRRCGGQADLVWITKYPETCGDLVKKGFRVVRVNTFEHFLCQYTAKVIVTNDSFPSSVALRRGQFTINTWHAGMNYKNIGIDHCKFRDKYEKKIFILRNKQPDAYLSGSRYFTEDTSKSFYFDQKVFLPYGNARNDIFFGDMRQVREKVVSRYSLGNAKTVLYAPTFRNNRQEDVHGLDFDRLLAALSERFGGEWKLLYRNHYFIRSKHSIQGKNVIDVSDYYDMNELLAAADVLVSDYSSCLWDFSFTGRPSFVYATDIGDYKEKERDFSYPLEKWPYAVCSDNDELVRAVLSFDEQEYLRRIREHQADGGSYDDGHASERAADLILQHLKLKN